jgi:hypothetical protein
VLADQENDLLRLALQFDRFDAPRQLARRPGIRPLAPLGVGWHPYQGAVALDEVCGATVMRRLREQHLGGLATRVEVAVWQ